MSAKNKFKREQRRIRHATPQGSHQEEIAEDGKGKDASVENLWNLPFEEIRGLRLKIPHSQIIRDEHQPRIDFDSELAREELEGLAESIRNQGLQQPVMVNFSARDNDGRNIFVIDKGERRWRAHKINRIEFVDCLVQETKYQEKFSLPRLIAQFVENFQRKNQTSKETIRVLRLIYEKRVAETGERYGAMDYAIKKLAGDIGRKVTWVKQFSLLMRLTPEFIDMLDAKKEGVPAVLNFQIGRTLSSVPQEDQEKIFKSSLKVFNEHGLNAQRSFISREARKLREKKGEKMRGRASDDRDRLSKISSRLRSVTSWLIDGKTAPEYNEFLKKIIGSMGAIDIDTLLKNLKDGLAPFALIQKEAEFRREKLLDELGLLNRNKEESTPNVSKLKRKTRTTRKPRCPKTKTPKGSSDSDDPSEEDGDKPVGDIILDLDPLESLEDDDTVLPEIPGPAKSNVSRKNLLLARRRLEEMKEARAMSTDPLSDDNSKPGAIRSNKGPRY